MLRWVTGLVFGLVGAVLVAGAGLGLLYPIAGLSLIGAALVLGILLIVVGIVWSRVGRLALASGAAIGVASLAIWLGLSNVEPDICWEGAQLRIEVNSKTAGLGEQRKCRGDGGVGSLAFVGLGLLVLGSFGLGVAFPRDRVGPATNAAPAPDDTAE